MADTLWIVTTTVGSDEDANHLAMAAVDNRLAACGQVETALVSHYRWNGEQQRTPEVRVVFKVSAVKKADFIQWLKANHRYEVPQILAWPAESGDPAYARWVDDA